MNRFLFYLWQLYCSGKTQACHCHCCCVPIISSNPHWAKKTFQIIWHFSLLDVGK
ncbi:hypothetical protein POPTR_007G055001v4 [Populus trichocarpa]|uniref:Uncharacterized protein n=1 Tax=Populus trichocarpa TaxID=3694 RepID=A0ACC0SPM4_POPTR|nr:hypothetical protein BDE02_07G049900 [Populus trichocarpa]KAI9391172.1 hypothetical protein POPTR_007G055001v4 [Populus trichocarpa]